MTATRTHLRDTDSARRTIAMAHAAKSRAGVAAYQHQTVRDELATSITALVHATHAPLDRIADDHRRFRERYNIGKGN